MRSRIPLALVVIAIAGAVGCEARQTSGGGRVWTLFDLVGIFEADGHVAAGDSLGAGVPASFFLKHHVAMGMPTDQFELSVLHGFMDGQAMTYVATELWENVPEIWAQPLYRAIDSSGAIVDDPVVREPWVFGVGPRSLFYSPFWQVLGFQVPDGTAVTDLLDTRAVVNAAKKTGGVRALGTRIASIAPADIEPPANWVENSYYDDTAAWDGVGGRRYLDMGPGRFDFDYEGVVREFPLFVFAKASDSGALEPQFDWSTVGGNRALFSAPPALVSGTGVGGAGGGGTVAPADGVNIEPVFGGLWRIHLVEVPATAGPRPDGRVVTNVACVSTCRVLDSQAAIEALGPGQIHETEFLLAAPLLQLGDKTFPTVSQVPPQPRPAE